MNQTIDHLRLIANPYLLKKTKITKIESSISHDCQKLITYHYPNESFNNNEIQYISHNIQNIIETMIITSIINQIIDKIISKSSQPNSNQNLNYEDTLLIDYKLKESAKKISEINTDNPLFQLPKSSDIKDISIDYLTDSDIIEDSDTTTDSNCESE